MQHAANFVFGFFASLASGFRRKWAVINQTEFDFDP
jgi:hypothetical protein